MREPYALKGARTVPGRGEGGNTLSLFDVVRGRSAAGAGGVGAAGEVSGYPPAGAGGAGVPAEGYGYPLQTQRPRSYGSSYAGKRWDGLHSPALTKDRKSVV